MKKAKVFSLMAEILLCGTGLAVTMADLTAHNEKLYFDLATVVLFAVAVFYTFYEYMVPHGDILRYALLAFAVIFGMLELAFSDVPSVWQKAGYLICVILATYLSGRLQKRTECTVLMAAVGVILLAISIVDVVGVQTGTVLAHLMPFMKTLLWGSLIVAYNSRYQQHKEAGASDAE